MLLPDGIYKRIPLLWMTGGIMFLLLGLGAGPEVDFFAAYLFLGAVCVTRAVWIYQARWKYFRRNEFRTMSSTQIIDRAKLKDGDKT